MFRVTKFKKISRVAPGLIAVLLAIFMMLPGIAGANCIGDVTGTVFGCGDTVTESCTFDDNMVCPAGHGLIVGADDITINGNDYSISGAKTCVSGEANDAGIESVCHSGVTIMNLEVKNFCHGIEMRGCGATPAAGNTIQDCEIHDNGDASASGSQTHGIKWNGIKESLITGCTVYNQGGDFTASGPPGGMGIYLCKGDDNEWSYNHVYNNKKSGMFMRCAPWRTWLHHNCAHDNNHAGIRGMCIKNYDGLCEYNYCYGDKKGPGIMYGGPIDDPDGGGPYPNLVRNNVCKGNWTHGIEFSREAWWAEFYDNVACENNVSGTGKEDIYVQDFCVVVGADSNTCATDYGFDDATALAGGYTGCTYGCNCDLNGDGVVSRADLKLFKMAWGDEGCWLDADFNGDGKVDRKDYRIFRRGYGDRTPFK